MRPEFKNVDDYIASFPEKTQELLRKVRSQIRKTAPDASEGISYGMPGYKLNGKPLVYFAAFQKHIGFYPTNSGIRNFSAELSDYKHSKGAVQFPIDKPLPFDLILKITKFRVKENLTFQNH
jgi:uncharacterized protein YdhG (YjbR/CyaY superfamily)